MGGKARQLGSPKQRALFALLLINAGRVVPVPRIIRSLWESSPPNSAQATLHSYVSRLRKALAGEGDQAGSPELRHEAPGYVLDIAPTQTDVGRFQAAVENGRLLFAEGQLEAASDAMAEAMNLWTGSPYSELASYEFATLETTRLEQVRLQASQIRADACLGLGEYDEVTRILSEEVRTNPLEERLGSLLMRAQYYAGRPAEALLTYERIRSHLAAELGAGTSKELKELRRSILRQDLGTPLADSSPSPSRQPFDALPSAPTARIAATPESPSTESAEPLRRSTSLVGREHELARLRSVMGKANDTRVMLVVGEQGVGKTRLLREFERELTSSGTEVVRALGAKTSVLPDYTPWLPAVCKIMNEDGHFDTLPVIVRSILVRARRAFLSGQGLVNRGGQPSDVERLALHTAACQALLSVGKPLVVLMDDIHLMDVHSLQLLQLLAREVDDAPLWVIATMREDRVSSSPDLRRTVAELLQSDKAENLRLSALSASETHTLIQQMRGTPVSWDLASAVHRATGGNLSLLIGLLKSGEPIDALEDPARGMPFELKVIIQNRLAEYSPAVIAVLETCAAMGPVIDRRLLHSVLRLQGATGSVGDALRTALIAVDPSDDNDLRFTQGLVRDLLLAGLDAQLKAELHLVIAQALATDAANGAGRAPVQ
ncbi:BTAD domain-containing putative transcriptional regulator [Streptomyces sp. NPDC058653]|uniref:BTAD domain-containing putative transcriptional regulator n=1 Tax=Streptomyces sp. NPDC058653 TaxID=3346576 RepID=UPI00365BD7B0